MIIKILAEGGAMKPGPALSQKLGPAGIPINQVIQKVNESTSDFPGLKVPVELDVNTKTKTFEVRVFSPPVAELLKKEIGVSKASGAQLKHLVGNLSIEQIISVSKTKMQNLLCKDLKSTVKTVVGTCVSLGILIESKFAKEIEKDIINGKYDKEIAQVKTETSPEKRKQLDDYFSELQKKQDIVLKQEQAAKAAEQETSAKKSSAKASTSTSAAKPKSAAGKK